MRQVSRWMMVCLAAGLLVACGGDGGNSTPPISITPTPPGEPAFGLQGKPALKDLRFPAAGVSSGEIRFSKAFPNLSFSAPLWFGQAPGQPGRAYVAEQGGRIWVFDFNAAVTAKTLFLDLTDRTRANGEQGLLGVAFAPDFASNRVVYAYYSKNTAPDVNAGNATVERFTVSADGLTANRSGTVFFSEPDPFNNHNGGSLLFGPDGMLYLALGDGGSGGDPQNNGQNLGSVLGKVLRFRPDGSIPADNPFVGTSGARGEVWAYGLRNPYRASFDRGTGQLWLGDVGQNEYEEIDVVTKGGNYGWRLREGMHDFNTTDARATVPLIEPIFEYSHDLGCSITGGVVYRGGAIPQLAGQYLYSDFCSGTVWALQHESGQRALANVELGSVPNPSGFTEDLSGEVYITAYDGFVYRVEPNTAAPGSTPFPQKLSETGLFTDTAALTPNAGLIEYEINAPFYSDGSRKRRWFGIPEGSVVGFSTAEKYDLPVGSATVKHFEITLANGSTRRLETRVFLRYADGWQGYTYKWNAAGTDADLLAGSEIETIVVRADDGSTRAQDYEYPSRAACLNCHTAAAGVPLGVRTAQLNRSRVYPFTGGSITDNQLRAYNGVELFNRDIGAASQYVVQTNPTDTTAPLAARARSYLEVNCSQCHQPGGPTGTDMDLRLTTPTASTRMVGVAPTGGDLGIAGAQRIRAGNKVQSLVWERMRRLDSNRMPPIASHVVDEAGLALIGQWIDAGAN
ncbi:MAG: PQQ-dependent sugar dehydrogenase [Pseudomonadota bacterium]